MAAPRKRFIMFVALGLLLVAAALCLTAYNLWESWDAGKRSQQVVEQLDASIGDYRDGQAFGQKMPVSKVDGHEYLGILSIPELDLTLPVMKDWDYNNLRISPCRYSGNYYDDDMVVCAHNYISHFRALQTIRIGVEVRFTNVKGEVFRYVVTNRETVEPTSIDFMIKNLNNSTEGFAGSWDLSLFTCQPGGATRCAVRCSRVK